MAGTGASPRHVEAAAPTRCRFDLMTHHETGRDDGIFERVAP
jgi:hypothetical protein